MSNESYPRGWGMADRVTVFPVTKICVQIPSAPLSRWVSLGTLLPCWASISSSVQWG